MNKSDLIYTLLQKEIKSSAAISSGIFVPQLVMLRFYSYLCGWGREKGIQPGLLPCKAHMSSAHLSILVSYYWDIMRWWVEEVQGMSLILDSHLNI